MHSLSVSVSFGYRSLRTQLTRNHKLLQGVEHADSGDYQAWLGQYFDIVILNNYAQPTCFKIYSVNAGYF